MKYYVNAYVKIDHVKNGNRKVFRVPTTGTQIYGFDNLEKLIILLCKTSSKTFRNALICDDNDCVIESMHNDENRYNYVKHVDNSEISQLENLFLELFYNDKRTSDTALSTYDEIEKFLDSKNLHANSMEIKSFISALYPFFLGNDYKFMILKETKDFHTLQLENSGWVFKRLNVYR
jgi:hypothetical protein